MWPPCSCVLQWRVVPRLRSLWALHPATSGMFPLHLPLTPHSRHYQWIVSNSSAAILASDIVVERRRAGVSTRVTVSAVSFTPRCVQFQASSWRGLILKVCRGAYPPLPGHLPYELQHLVKQMFKTNPKDRPSVRTILTSQRVSRLLRAHLPSQVKEKIKKQSPPSALECAAHCGGASCMATVT